MNLTPIVIDVEGDRAPFIITELERAGAGDLWLYFDVETIRENLYELAALDPLWFDRLARIFGEMGKYGDVGEGNMRRTFMDVNGASEMQRRGGWATLEETLEYMDEKKSGSKGKRAQYLETAIERFQNWIPAIAPIFRYRSGYAWESLKNHVIIYDIRGLTLDGQLFFQNYLLQKLLFIQERLSSGTETILYDIDELHKFIYSAYQKQSQYPPIILEAARTARKRNIFITYKDQFMSMVPKELVGSCNTLIVFRLRDQDDLRKAEKELNLSSDRTAHLAKQDDRHCINVNNKMTEPTAHEIEEVDMENLLSYEEIKELMKPKLERLECRPVEAHQTTRAPIDPRTSDRETLAFVLERIISTQGRPLSEAQAGTGLNRKQFWRAVDALESFGLVCRPERISLGRRGSVPYFTEALQPAARFLDRDWDDVRMRGRGSLHAKVMTYAVASWLERNGEKPLFEYRGSDLAVVRGSGLTCFEIETAPNVHVARNIRRNISEIGAEEVFVVMDRQEDLERAAEICRTRLSQDELAKVRFLQTKEFL